MDGTKEQQTNGRTNGKGVEGWMVVRKDGWKEVQKDGWKNRKKEGRMNGRQTERWNEGW